MADANVSTILEQLGSVISEEIKQELKDLGVRRWLDQLKDTSYDMEDVLDEWKTAIMKLQMDNAENGPVIPKKKDTDAAIPIDTMGGTGRLWFGFLPRLSAFCLTRLPFLFPNCVQFI
ncbi:NB-ARC domain-containing disease resistance protein [Melia azedarach]|uniref:NB-ARC domain-containing disease resistance protein n=1 Tax=Melia azedarach TaxID=155640 RepID=A0ACC1Y6E4_MELAZ|nr:NB-ARC domain-containing disease resistance protein [Melia azedarach]